MFSHKIEWFVYPHHSSDAFSKVINHVDKKTTLKNVDITDVWILFNKDLLQSLQASFSSD